MPNDSRALHPKLLTAVRLKEAFSRTADVQIRPFFRTYDDLGKFWLRGPFMHKSIYDYH